MTQIVQTDIVPCDRLVLARTDDSKSRPGAVILMTGNTSADFNHLYITSHNGIDWFPGARVIHAYQSAEYERQFEEMLLKSDDKTNFYVLTNGGYGNLDRFRFAKSASARHRYLFVPDEEYFRHGNFFIRFDAQTLAFLLNMRFRFQSLKKQNPGLDRMQFLIEKDGLAKNIPDPNNYVIGTEGFNFPFEGAMEEIPDSELKISEAIPFLSSELVHYNDKNVLKKGNRNIRLETNAENFKFYSANGASVLVSYEEIERFWYQILDENDLPSYEARNSADFRLREVTSEINREAGKPFKIGTREKTFHLPERLVLITRILRGDNAFSVEALVGRLSAGDARVESVLHTYELRYNEKGDYIMDIKNPFASL